MPSGTGKICSPNSSTSPAVGVGARMTIPACRRPTPKDWRQPAHNGGSVCVLPDSIRYSAQLTIACRPCGAGPAENITIRLATAPGRHHDPAAFAVTAGRAAAARDASILSAHTAEEIICVVSVPAATGPEAAVVALAVVADALKAGEAVLLPGRSAVVPAVVGGS